MKDHRLAISVLTAVPLLLLGLFYPYFGLVPSWDAGWYLACLENAVDADFQLKNFNCAGHTSFTYMLILSIGQYLRPGSAWLLNFTNYLLWLGAAGAFYGACGKLLPGSPKIDRALCAAAFAFMPTCTAQIFHLNLDFAIVVTLVPVVYFLLSRRFLYTAGVGTILVFSKEIGVVLYFCLLATFFCFFITDFFQRSRAYVLKSACTLSIPLCLFALRTLFRYVRHPDQNLFYTEEDYSFREKPLLEMVFDFNFFDPSFASYLADIFLLNFNWIVTGLILAGILVGRKKLIVLSQRREYGLILCMFLVTVYLVTRHRPFNHVRYLLPTFPFLLFLLFFSLQALFKSVGQRVLVMSSLCVCYVAANLYSVDPLSRIFFGTFEVGNHKLLNMSSRFYPPNDTHPIFVRDELVYNLEYLKLDQMLNWIFQDLSIEPRQTLMGSQDSRFFWPEFVDSDTRERTARRTEVFRPHYFDHIEEFSTVVEKPIILYYFEFPSMLSPQHFQKLQEWYTQIATRVYEQEGYRLNVHVFELRH